MRKTSEILVKEHKNILKVVDALEKEIEKEQLDKNFIKKVIDFIKNYADKFHHAKEESILFKEFTKSFEEGCAHCSPVEQMLYEHNVGRDGVKKMSEGLEKKDDAKIAEGSREYIMLIREHIFKEDNILYPMADKSISKDVEKKILLEFNKIAEKNASIEGKYMGFIKLITKR